MGLISVDELYLESNRFACICSIAFELRRITYPSRGFIFIARAGDSTDWARYTGPAIIAFRRTFVTLIRTFVFTGRGFI